MAATTKLIRPVDATTGARIAPEVSVDCAPGSPQVIQTAPVADDIPFLLAGPILRRVSPTSVVVWVATSLPSAIRGRVLRPGDADSDTADWTVLGEGRGTTTQLGTRLYVTSIVIEATSDTPPRVGRYPMVILAYDLTFDAPAGAAFTDEGGLLERSEIAYGSDPLPTFLIGLGRSARKVNLYHASCRKPHGLGEDAMVSADRHMRYRHRQQQHRASAMLHTGDQIYADDVEPRLLAGILAATPLLFGQEERLPDGRCLSEVGPGQRDALVRSTGLTVDEGIGGSHLMGFTEFALMHLLAWSPAIWGIPAVEEALSGFECRTATLAARRLLANVANYMMWDDHEISDDWPISQTRKERVLGDSLGKWIIANGMAAAWLFQLRDNSSAPRNDLLRTIDGYLTSVRGFTTARATAHSALRDRYADVVVAETRFGFVVRSTPPIIVLDTRTERKLTRDASGPDTAPLPGLLNEGAVGHLRRQIDGLGSMAPEVPFLVVSPAPVIGFSTAENIIRRASAARVVDLSDVGDLALGTTYLMADPEAWGYNEVAYRSFLQALFDSHRNVVCFSGDVHYGFMASATFLPAGAASPLRIAQLTSSALKNSPDSNLDHLLRGLALGATSSGALDFQNLSAAEDAAVAYLPVISTAPSSARLEWEYLPVSSGATGLVRDTNNFGVVEITWAEDGVARVKQDLGGGPDTEMTLDVPRSFFDSLAADSRT